MSKDFRWLLVCGPRCIRIRATRLSIVKRPESSYSSILLYPILSLAIVDKTRNLLKSKCRRSLGISPRRNEFTDFFRNFGEKIAKKKTLNFYSCNFFHVVKRLMKKIEVRILNIGPVRNSQFPNEIESP